MCEQCMVNPLYFGEVIPGWTLIRARRSNEMKVGDWGLVQINDPTLVWSSNLTWPEDYDEVLSNPPADFIEALDSAHYLEIVDLTVAALEAGFDSRVASDPETNLPVHSMHLDNWLWNRMIEHLKTAEASTDDDPFPHLDAMAEHNYALGKD